MRMLHLSVGQPVKLVYNGNGYVPKYLNGEIVTVLRGPYTYQQGRGQHKWYVRIKRQHGGTDWTERTVLVENIAAAT